MMAASPNYTSRNQHGSLAEETAETEMNRDKRIAFLKGRIGTLNSEKRRLLAYVCTAQLSKKEREKQGDQLDGMLDKLRELSDELFDLSNE